MNREKRCDPRRCIEYEIPGGWRVVAGKTDADNDFVSLKVAKPRDWWFHVRGMPGSHVLLLAEQDQEPDREALKRAAAIAAYHSKARAGGMVPVSCTRAQNVTKARGTKAGSVQIRKEIVLKVHPPAPEQMMEMRAEANRQFHESP